MCPNQNGIKLEINNRRKTVKFTNTWKLNNTMNQKRKSKGELEN